MVEISRTVLRAALLSAVGLTMFCATAQQASTLKPVLQCWADSKGVRSCGDAVPPSEARRQRELVDQRGVVQKVLPAEKSADQIADEKRVTDQRERQAAYDHYLLQAYQSVSDLEKVRDERLNSVNGRLALANKALADNTAALAQLHQRDQPVAPSDDAQNANLKDDIKAFAKARDENLVAIARIEDERRALNEGFARDIQRYQILRSAARISPR